MKTRSTTRGRIARTVGTATALLVAASALAACSSTPSTSASATTAGRDTLTVSIASDVVSLDPQLQGDLTSMSIADNIFDTLTVRGADNSLKPGLATKWKQVDPMTWQFTIRKGVTFTDGEPLNADAVAFSINRLLDPATKSPIVELVNVKDAVVVNDTTVNFEMKAPDPVIPAKVSLFGGVVLPPKLIQKEGAPAFAQTQIRE